MHLGWIQDDQLSGQLHPRLGEFSFYFNHLNMWQWTHWAQSSLWIQEKSKLLPWFPKHMLPDIEIQSTVRSNFMIPETGQLWINLNPHNYEETSSKLQKGDQEITKGPQNWIDAPEKQQDSPNSSHERMISKVGTFVIRLHDWARLCLCLVVYCTEGVLSLTAFGK